jgi:hypothetical protein
MRSANPVRFDDKAGIADSSDRWEGRFCHGPFRDRATSRLPSRWRGIRAMPTWIETLLTQPGRPA